MIETLTKDCPREDCRIYGGNSGVSTCMGWTPVYDKQGKRIDNGDPNSFTTSYSCTTCKKHWSVTTQRGDTRITGVVSEVFP
jgi:hypothetical protein